MIRNAETLCYNRFEIEFEIEIDWNWSWSSMMLKEWKWIKLVKYVCLQKCLHCCFCQRWWHWLNSDTDFWLFYFSESMPVFCTCCLWLGIRFTPCCQVMLPLLPAGCHGRREWPVRVPLSRRQPPLGGNRTAGLMFSMFPMLPAFWSLLCYKH